MTYYSDQITVHFSKKQYLGFILETETEGANKIYKLCLFCLFIWDKARQGRAKCNQDRVRCQEGTIDSRRFCKLIDRRDQDRVEASLLVSILRPVKSLRKGIED
jgi:hypothetical protein